MTIPSGVYVLGVIPPVVSLRLPSASSPSYMGKSWGEGPNILTHLMRRPSRPRG
ncbi:MAG: hypothetical protein QXD24_02060 [Candidatus Caldarchaeum sp.]